MASRRQQRAKRMRRLQHQEATATGTKYMNYDDGTQIEVPRGPKPSVSRHKTDKPRFGANRQSIEDGIRSIFTKAGVEPTKAEMKRAIELSGRGNKANDRLARYISSVLMARIMDNTLSDPSEWQNDSKVEVIAGTGEANSGPHTTRFDADEVELMDPEIWDGTMNAGYSEEIAAVGMKTNENGACPLCGRFLRNASHKDGCPGVHHADEIEIMDRETFRLAAQIQADQTTYGFSMTENGERVDPAVVKPADRGTYTLTVNGKTTEQIPYDASLEELRKIGQKIGITIEKVMASRDKLSLEAGDQVVEIPVPHDHGDKAYAGRPTEEQWAELEATAKKRKRGATGYIRVLEAAGYELLSDDHDPRERESWVRS